MPSLSTVYGKDDRLTTWEKLYRALKKSGRTDFTEDVIMYIVRCTTGLEFQPAADAEAAACAACAAYVSYAADVYATEVADAAYGSAYAARAAAYASAEAVAYVVADAATDAAEDAQIKMIAELGNPFRKERVK